ncbi:MAG: hypothetical protein IAG10_02520, partial [Planctomycetaceae bacterium]|nr:hypothetical protein [Planctomycetaceae bacterium]
IACALHWFNPLVWFAAWRLNVERERACDDLVLASGVLPSAYAGHLLDIVTGHSPARWTQSCGLAMARKSSLEDRFAAILSKNLNRRGVSVALANIALAIAIGIAVPIAMLRAAVEEWSPPHAASVVADPLSDRVTAEEHHQWKQSIQRPSRSWDYDGKRILGHVGYDICLWDATTGKLLHRMKGHKERIKAVQFSPDGNHALSSSWIGQGGMTMRISRDTSVTVWDLATGRDRHIFKGQVAGEFSPDGKRIVSFSQRPGTGIPNPDWGELTLPSTGEVWQNGTEAKFDAAVWETSTGRQLAQTELGENGDPYWGSLHFSPDGRSIVRVETGIALLYSASDGRETGRQSQRLARSLRYTSGGALASIDPEEIKVTDIKSGQAIRSISHGLKSFWAAAWTHDGSRVAVIPSDESEIKIWDIETGKLTTGAKNGPYPQKAAIVSPDNRRLVVEWGGANDVEPGLGIYELNTGNEIARIDLAKWSHLVGFSPDSATLLVGGSEFLIYDAMS